MAKQAKIDLNLESMDYSQLCQARDQVLELIAQKRAEARQELQDEFAKKAMELGFAPDEVFGGRKGTKGSSKKTGTTQAKYRHPTDPSLTWSGRGRMAGWLAELVAKGNDKEKYAI